jgi:hypothetical protein
LWQKDSLLPAISWGVFPALLALHEHWQVILAWPLQKSFRPTQEIDHAAKAIADAFAQGNMPFRLPTLEEKLREAELSAYFEQSPINARHVTDKVKHDMIGNFFKPSALLASISGESAEGLKAYWALNPPPLLPRVAVSFDCIDEAFAAHKALVVANLQAQQQSGALTHEEAIKAMQHIAPDWRPPHGPTQASLARLDFAPGTRAQPPVFPHMPYTEEQVPLLFRHVVCNAPAGIASTDLGLLTQAEYSLLHAEFPVLAQQLSLTTPVFVDTQFALLSEIARITAATPWPDMLTTASAHDGLAYPAQFAAVAADLAAGFAHVSQCFVVIPSPRQGQPNTYHSWTMFGQVLTQLTVFRQVSSTRYAWAACGDLNPGASLTLELMTMSSVVKWYKQPDRSLLNRLLPWDPSGNVAVVLQQQEVAQISIRHRSFTLKVHGNTALPILLALASPPDHLLQLCGQLAVPNYDLVSEAECQLLKLTTSLTFVRQHHAQLFRDLLLAVPATHVEYVCCSPREATTASELFQPCTDPGRLINFFLAFNFLGPIDGPQPTGCLAFVGAHFTVVTLVSTVAAHLGIAEAELRAHIQSRARPAAVATPG